VEDVNDLNDLHSQRGSAMLEIVIALALVSFLFMMAVGRLIFITRVSQQEDARVQGLMAARIKIEELRSGRPGSAFSGEGGNHVEFPSEDPEGHDKAWFADFHMLGRGTFTVERVSGQEDALYKVVVRIYDKKDSEVYSTQTTVWVQP